MRTHLRFAHARASETRLIVSEPLLNLPGAWTGVPEGSAGIVRPGTDEIRPVVPISAGHRPPRPMSYAAGLGQPHHAQSAAG